jgi:hypothetical protein
MVSRSGEANSQPQAGTAIEQVGGELASAQHETAQAQDQVADLKASDDDRDGYDHPASSAARLLMGTRLFFPRFLLLLPALFSAMATACFCGLPAFISVLMFELIVLWEDPFLRGMLSDLSSLRY